MEFSGRLGKEVEGKLTELRMVPVSRKSRMVLAATSVKQKIQGIQIPTQSGSATYVLCV